MPTATATNRTALVVQDAAPGASVQDLGRPGWATVGVPRGGAADRGSLRLANRLLGNPESAAALEVTAGGCLARAEGTLWCAVTGADGPVLVEGREVGSAAAFPLPDGARVEIGRPRRGLRSYLAVRGGFDVPRVLGSASEDVLSAIVPTPVGAGVRLPVGSPAGPLPDTTFVPVAALPELPRLRLHPGPRRDWVAASSLTMLTSVVYTVSAHSNRVGVRLTGPALTRAITSELPSEGLLPGSVQVPPSGEPIIFLADVPTTGGYPVVAVVTETDLDVIGQLVPGQGVRLTWA